MRWAPCAKRLCLLLKGGGLLRCNLGGRLDGCTLFVTLEPCAMCAGASINARLDRVVYGAYDRRFGALGSLCNLADLPFNHALKVRAGVLEEECRALLSDYFKAKR